MTWRPSTARLLAFLLAVITFHPSAFASDLIEVFTEPYRSIDVAAAEQGILDNIAVEQGDLVTAGDEVATLNRDVLLASLEIAKMRAKMQAPLLRAGADVRQKQRRFEKIVGLHNNRHASEEELDSAKALLEIAQAGLLEARENQKLATLQVAEIEAQLRQRTISSPVTGQVVKIHKDDGEYVASTEPVVATIIQLDKLRVKFYVDTTQAYDIQRGDKLPIVFLDTNQRVTGVVEFVSPTTDADSSTVRVEVAIDNPKGEFRSGVSVRLDSVRQATNHLKGKAVR